MIVIGIMAYQMHNQNIRDGACPFGEPVFYRRLCRVAARLGMLAFVFAPDCIDWVKRQVHGFTYDEASRTWRAGHYPLPDAVYDRWFPPAEGKARAEPHRLHIRRLHQEGIPFIARGLNGKWDVQRALARDAWIRRHLPATAIVREPADVLGWLNKLRAVFLKPHAGTHGKGAVRVAHCAGGGAAASAAFEARGRDARNAPFTRRFADDRALTAWLADFTAGRRYLIQPYLRLDDETGAACDIRALMQKDGRGRWQLTGMAVRRGQPGSVTSNLHGGGTAIAVQPYLASRFGPGKGEQLLRALQMLAERIPPVLEQSFGRLAELGIDLGIDQLGRVWVIEVNSKPGRTSFDQLDDRRARMDSVERPLRYARQLIRTLRPFPNIHDRQLRRVT
jgi:hypothetical protein